MVLLLEVHGPITEEVSLLEITNNIYLLLADTRMAFINTATQEETLLTPRNQEMVVGQNLQLPPNHLFGDNSELVVGVSPYT